MIAVRSASLFFRPLTEVPFSDNTNAVTNIRIPFANIFMVGKQEAGACIPSGGFCLHNSGNCCGSCGCLIFPGGPEVCYGTGC
ncbi:hypothetical protein DITRI_Ditri12bG0100500 [Diplodiscus trichospermus]